MMQFPVIVTLQLHLFFSHFSSIYASMADEERYFFCNGTGNYSIGSIYGRNVNITLTSLAANGSLDGFSITSVGQDLDMVYGLVQCRSDVSGDDCQTCVDTAAEEMSQFCLNKKEAMIGYNNCYLRYSDWRFFSTASSSPIFYFYNPGNAIEPDRLNTQLANLLKNLSSTAASNTSKFAVGSTSYLDFSDIYGMVQCTRDLPENSCLSCLQAIISFIPQCCNQKLGARIFTMSCNLRFELYAFVVTSSTPTSRILSALPLSPLVLNSVTGVTTNTTSSDGKKRASITVVVVVVSIAAVALLVILIVCSCYFQRKAKKKAFGNFSDENKLGQGGFGPVYKGILSDGREIAVKRLSSNSGQGLEELKTEVMLVAKLLHRNLVTLLGFCLEEEKLLVYEYLPNGSLDKILFDQSKRLSLEWERRYKIIAGIARGLLYLHEDSQLRIIHRDLKASNIFGYMAPKYAKNGYFSTKSDVYSFGVLVLEIVTGRKNSSSRNLINLQSQAWLHWTNGTALGLLDPVLSDQWPRLEVLKCIHIGLLCVQEAAADRPTMSEIIMMLSSQSITDPAPSRPAFFVANENFTTGSANDSGSSQSADLLQRSVNEVTISEIHPR